MKTNWQTERTMSPVQYRAALKDLDMNVAQAARYLGVGERTSHRYVRGETSIPVAVVLLLRALKAIEHLAAELARLRDRVRKLEEAGAPPK